MFVLMFHKVISNHFLATKKIMDIYIICSKRWGSRVDKQKSSPAFLESSIENNLSTVDLIIRTMDFSIPNVYLIGGYHIEKLVDRFSGLKFIYEEKWKSKTWNFCKDILSKTNKEEVLFISSEIIFNKNIVEKLKTNIKKKKSFICSVDYKNIDQLEKKHFAYSSKNQSENFAGIIYFSNKYNQNFKKLSDYINHINFSELYILSNITKNNILCDINILKLNNCWETIFKDRALARSILGTKAETLQRLKPLVKESSILPCLMFSVLDWKTNKDQLLNKIVNFTNSKNIILRSSSGIEDSWNESHAGAFDSILNILKDDKTKVIRAVNEIIKGYKKSRQFSEKWQILIQPQQEDVKISGVAFTSSVTSGAPYIEIYYDDITNSTDSITSGTGKNTKSSVLFKKFANNISKGWKKKLVSAFLEIERIVSYDKLDIEFCIPSNGLPIIFQVRPITGIIEQSDKINELENRIIDLNNFYKNLSLNNTPKTQLILSNTSDWNPAEMIGENIAFLEKSLYEYLITNDTWSKSRKLLGYNFDHNSFDLMVVMGNNPFINVNKSINSLIPNNINYKLKSEILKSSLNFLRKNRHKHSEIEFDVIPNCYFPNFEDHWRHIFIKKSFCEKEHDNIVRCYKDHTLEIIKNVELFKNQFNDSIDKLNTNFQIYQLAKNKTYFLHTLLNITKSDGVLPFAIAARLGFISLQWIKSIEKNCKNGNTLVTEFLSNIPNIATNITKSLGASKFDISKQKTFLENYGFLRPNSYNLLSDDYFILAEQGMLFNGKYKAYRKKINNIPYIDLSFVEKKEIFKKMETPIKTLLQKFKIEICEKKLIKFLVLGIFSREYMKFAFMRHVWAIIETIKKFSIEKKIDLADAKFIKIEEYLDFSKNFFGEAELQALMSQSRLRQKRFEQNKKIKLPEVIISSNDFYSFYDNAHKGYFISSHKIKGKIVDYNRVKTQDDLKGKIIKIESADPGFDWIFSKGILAFITCHGGLGSHMAIRASEFDMPAVIGCGGKQFKKFEHGSIIELDCNNKSIGFF